MITFNQKTDGYRPTNRVKFIPSVDIVKTLETFTLDDVIEKIQKIVKQKNMRVSEFMRDFDKLRSGSITETQFLSCLSMMKIYLSQKESEMLTEKYRNPEKDKEILWRNFCDDIDNVFVVKKLEKRNDINELLSITKSSFKLNELSLPDQAILQEILKEMKGFFEVNRIDPKPAFTNYDHLKRGKVLKPQFKKICHSMKFFIAESDIEILMKKYGDPISNEINYIVILNDSNEIGVGKKFSQENEENEKKIEEIMPSLSSSNNFYTYQTHFLNINFHVNDILDKIKHFVKINRIRLQQFFDDFDSLRKGIVSKAKFRTALNMANLSLRSEEYDLLEQHYALPEDDRIDYKSLIEEVETVFTIKGLEKNPLMRPNEYKMPDFLDPEKRLDGEQSHLLHNIMIKLALFMRKYRVMPKAYFKDADKAKVGIIASSKFASILSFLRLHVEEKEMNMLIKRFHGKSMIEINYVDFDYVLSYYCNLIDNELE